MNLLNTYYSFQVNMNGYVTFGVPISDPSPSTFPHTINPNIPIIAPFWSDIDGKKSGMDTCVY